MVTSMSQETREEKKRYELSVLLQEEEAGVKVKDVLAQHGGELLSETSLEKVRLAYPIKKQTFAFLGSYSFLGNPERISEFSKELLLDGITLRHMVIEKKAGATKKKNETEKTYAGRQERTVVRRPKPALSSVLTNEELEKKIEEILK